MRKNTIRFTSAGSSQGDHNHKNKEGKAGRARKHRVFFLGILLAFAVSGVSVSQKMVVFAEEGVVDEASDSTPTPAPVDPAPAPTPTPDDATPTPDDSIAPTPTTADPAPTPVPTPTDSTPVPVDSTGSDTGGLEGSSTGDSSAAAEEPEPVLAAALTTTPLTTTPDGLNETQETYSVPEGSATVLGIDQTFSNNSESNAIQQAVEKAIQYATVNTARTSTIVVKNGTYEGGLNIDVSEQSSLGQLLTQYIRDAITGGSGSFTKEDIVLRIVSEDIIGEDGTLLENTYSAGNAQVIGDINISGLNVVLAGIYLSTKGSLSCKDAQSFTYVGTAQDDRVDIALDNISDHDAATTDIHIDSGGGDDSLNVTITQAPTYSVGITKGVYESITSRISSLPTDPTEWTTDQISQIADALADEMKSKVTIDTNNLKTDENLIMIELGNGNDELDAKLINSTNITADFLNLNSLAADDTFLGFKLDLSKTALTLLGQDGNDDISLAGGMALDLQYQIASTLMDRLNISLLPDLSAAEYNSMATIDGGKGDDLITLDSTAPFSSYRQYSYQISDMQGSDRLHLTGKLDGSAAQSLQVTQQADGDHITAKALAQISFPMIGYSLDKKKDLNIVAHGIEMYTDSLSNKNQINLSSASGSAGSYTDYILDGIGTDGVVDTTVSLSRPQTGLWFTNLIASATTLNVHKLIADGMNVILNGVEIVISGMISCANLIVNAVPKAVLSWSQSLIENDLEPEDDLGITFEVNGADTQAKIEVTSTGDIRTSGGVFLKAENIQDLFYIDSSLLSGDSLNHFSYKDAKAVVEIKGKLTAQQSVRAESILVILLDGDEQLLKKVIPFSVQIAIGNASVTVSDAAGIDAKASVFLHADSTIHITSSACAGLAPVAIAIAVATPVTTVVIQDDAVIRADGDVVLKADSVTRTINVATGKPALGLMIDPQSGGFIALTVIDQETYVKILNRANVTSLGTISLLSDSVARSDTAAVSIPADESTGTIKTKNAIKYAESLLGVKKANNQSLLGKIASTITGSNLIGNLFTSGTKGAEKEPTSTTPKSTTQLMGSLGIGYISNENLVLIQTTKNVSAQDDLNLNAYARTDSFVKADGSLYKTPAVVPGAPTEAEPDRALGIGIALVIYHHGNNAKIETGQIYADGLLLNAQSGYSTSTAISKSGHIPTKNTELGVGGAITVHIVSDQTQAILGSGAAYHVKGGDVIVTASANRSYVTVADASGKRTNFSLNVAGITIPISTTEYNKSGIGIGAGIAVAIIGGDVLAQIEDGVILIHEGSVPLNSIQVEAKSKVTENTYAAAGAGSSTAIVPVVATDISGFSTEAMLGSGTTIDYLQTDAVVLADSTIVRTLASDAAAVGTGVGVGGSFAVSVYNDSTKAYNNRSLNARNIAVTARSIDRMNGKAKASATGAAAPAASSTTSTTPTTEGPEDPESVAKLQEKGEADKIADQNLSAASDLSDKSNTKNVNKSSVNNLSANRQQAQTSEGNVQVAAAFAVNIMKHSVVAQIGNGLTLIARAIEGDSESGLISLIAKEDTDAILAANASATKSTTGVGVAVAVNVVTTENKAVFGTSKIQAKNLKIEADSIEAAQKKTVEEILESLVTYLISVEGTDLLIKVLEDNMTGTETLQQLIEQELITQNNKLPETDRRTAEELVADQTAVDQAIKAVFVAKLKNEDTAEISSDLVKAVVDSLMEEFFDVLLTPSTMIDLLLTGRSTAIKELLSKAVLTAEVTKARLEEALVAYMRSRFGGNDEADGLGSKISTAAVSGAGASNVGIAGAVAVTVVTALSQAVIMDLPVALAEDIKVTDTISLTSDRFQKLYTTATSSADKQGAPDKNKNGTGAQSSTKSVGVGAAAAISVVDATSEAGIGQYRTVQAGALDIRAILTNDLETVAVAGQDPIAHREAAIATTPTLGQPSDPNFGSYATSTKSISVDAAAAVGVITNTVRAFVDEHTSIKTTGTDSIETVVEEGETPQLVNLYLYSAQRGETYTAASAFACGSTTAVGAAVAVNLATSDVSTQFLGQGDIAGSAKLDARTFDTDESRALATVTGANLDRYLEKIRNVEKYMSPGTYPPTGAMNAKIVNKLNTLANPVMTGATGLINNLPLSTSAMKSQKTATTSAPDTTKAETTANQNTSTPVSGQSVDSTAKQSKSINIAAAVAVNVTKHTAQILQSGILFAKRIGFDAENNGNFLTMATGAAVTLFSNNASNFSLGVAVTTNLNRALVTIDGELVARGDQATSDNDGDITVDATLTQNMDGKYKGLLGAQAIAGSVAGSGGDANIAGAVAVMIANADTLIVVKDGSILRGKAITMNAIDKSKYAVRAGSASVSTGTKVAVGAAFALIYAQNNTKILIGDDSGLKGVLIIADSLTMNAHKEKVDQSDYQIPFDESTLFTVDAASEKEKGLINLTTTEGSSGKYSVSVTLGMDDLLKVIDLLNYLSSVNYYAEAFAGTIVAGNSNAAVAGSMAMVFLTNQTQSAIGKNVTIECKNDLLQTALDHQNSRLISGALSISKANAGVGLTVGFLSNNTNVAVLIGDDTKITAANMTGSAKAITDIWVITVAASLAAGSSGASIGGAITAIDSSNVILMKTGDRVVFTATDSISLLAENDQALTLISTSASASSGVAVGGTVAVIVIDDTTTARTGSYNTFKAGNEIRLSGADTEKLINIIVSVSGSTGTAAVAGTLGVVITESATLAQAGDYNNWETVNGDILILADSSISQIFIITALAGSSGQVAVGGTVAVYVFNQSVKALTGAECVFVSGRNILIQATGENRVLLITVAGAAASKVAVAGAIPVVVMTTQTLAETGTKNQLTAQDSVGVIAEQNNELISVAGGVAGAGNVGVGATIHTAILSNQVTAKTGDDSHITGYAVNQAMDSGIRLPGTNRAERRHGVIVNAYNQSTIFMLSVSGAISGTVSVTGVVNTLLVNNQVKALIGKNTAVNAREVRTASSQIASSGSDLDDDSESDVEVEAVDVTRIYLFAGGISAAGSVGVGATAAVTILDNQVSALIGEGSHIYAADDILVRADADTDLVTLLIAFGVAGSVGVAGAVSVLLFENKTEASTGDQVVLNAGDEIRILASQDNLLISAAAGLAAGEYAGVAAVAPIVKFLGTTNAFTGNSSRLNADGTITIEADSKENIITAGIGLGGGIGGVSGTFELLIMQVTTKAYTGSNNLINGNHIRIHAVDHYTLTGAAGAIAGGAAGVGISLLVSLSYNTVTAYIGTNSQATALGTITVLAESDRQISAYAVTAAGGGVAVSGTVVIVLAGSKLNQESYENINSSSIKPQANVDSAFAQSDARTLKYSQKDAQGNESDADVSAYLDERNKSNTSVNSGSVNGTSTSIVSADPAYQNTQDKEGTSSAEDVYSENKDANGKTTADQIAGSDTMRPVQNLQDTTAAFIGAGSKLTAGGDITILAIDNTNLDVITGAVAIGGGAGVGLGVSVVILYSNVLAYADQTQIQTDGKLTIHALAGSNAINNQNAKAVESGKAGKDDTYTLRVITIVGAAGFGGTSLSASIASVDIYTTVNAYLGRGSRILRADQVTIQADSNYGLLQVVTAGVSVGNTAIALTVSRANYDAVVRAAVESDVQIALISGSLNVIVNSDTTLRSDTVSAGGGVASVNAAVALAFYTARMDAFIGQGVVINQCGNINLILNADVAANANIIGITAGAVAAGANVVLVKLTPVLLNYIGSTPSGYTADAGATSNAISADAGTGGRIHAADITVLSQVGSKATANGIAGGLGIAALNGSVVIVINRTASIAAIRSMDLTAQTVSVKALMDTSSTIQNSAVSAGGVTAGLVVAYAETKAVNQALLDATNASVHVTNLFISAGTEADVNESKAAVTLISGTLSYASVSVNAAVALNQFTNHALLTGSNADLVVAGTVLIENNMTAMSHTNATGINAGALVIGALIALSFNKADGTAGIWLNGSNALTADQVILHAYMNRDASIQAAQALIYSGTGSLISANGGVALAAARAVNQAYAKGNFRITNALILDADGRSNAKAAITAASAGLVAVGIMISSAYADGTNLAWIQNDADNLIEAGSILLTSTQTADADAQTRAGAALAAVAVKVNIASAITNAVTKAYIMGSQGTLISHGDITVAAASQTNAHAVVSGIPGLPVELSIYSITGNVAVALLAAQTQAYVSHQNLTAAGDLNITALQNLDGSRQALAECEASTKVGYLQVEISQAIATSNAVTKAYSEASNLAVTGTISILSGGTAKATASAAQNTISYLVAAGVVNIYTYAKGSYLAYLDATDSTVQAGNLVIRATLAEAKADSQAQMLTGGVVDVKIQNSYARIEPVTSAYITGSNGQINVTGSGEVTAVSKNNHANALIRGVSVASGVTIANAFAKTSLAALTQAYIDGNAQIALNGNLNVSADYNAVMDTQAQSSVGVSLANVGGNETFSESNSVTKAYIGAILPSGSVLLGPVVTAKGNVVVQAIGHVTSNINNATVTGLSVLGVGIVITDSYVNNTVQSFIGTNTVVTSDGSIQILSDGSAKVIIDSVVAGNSVLNGNSVVLTARANEMTYADISEYAQLHAGNAIIIHAAGNAATQITILGVGVGAVKLGAYIVNGYETLDTQIRISDNAAISADGAVEIEALDKLKAGNDVILYGAGLASGEVSIIKNTGNQKVLISVGKNTLIHAGNDLNITTATDHQMNAQVSSSGIGLASVAASNATNELTRNNQITILDGSRILADGSIVIAANSMPSNRTDAINTVATGGSAGLFEISGAKAESRLYSNTDIIIGNGCKIITTYGNVALSAVSGSSTYTKAFRSAAQAVTKNTTEAVVYIRDLVSVLIGTGNAVKTLITGANVTISAIINLQKIFAQSGSTMYAVSALTNAVTTVTIDSAQTITIGAADIRGYESVSLIAMTQEVNHVIRSDSEIIGAVGVVKATTNVNGQMKATITTSADTEIASADVLIQAFAPTMKTYAHTATAEAVANTILQKVFKIIGYVVKWIAKAVGWVVGLFSKKAKKKILEAVYGWVDELVSSTAISKVNDTFSSDSVINLNGKISVGDAAAGIVIDIAPDGNVSYTGISAAGWANGIVVDHVNKTVTIPYIYNDKSGSLAIDAGTGELKGQLAIYLNNYLTYVTVNNHSDYDLILSDITVFNSDVNAFTYSVNAGTNRNSMTLNYGDETPVVTITADQASDVILNGEINNVKGELNVSLSGGDLLLGDGAYTDQDEILRGDTEFLTKMFVGTNIWTNSLKVTGAGNVGTSALDRLMIGILRYSGNNTTGKIAEPARNGKVWIEAAGNIYVSLALLEVLISKSTLTDAELANQSPIDRLYLEKIRAGGTADITLPAAKRLFVYENGTDYEGMEITSPGEYEEFFILTPDQSLMAGNTQYIILNTKGQDSGYRLGADGLLTLNNELELEADVFDTKTTANITIGDTAMELRLYRLPDGSNIYVNAEGKVLMISSLKHTLSLNQFTYDAMNNSILFNDTQDLTDSYITFDANQVPLMHIGTNGITMYVEQNADGSWELPNGIKIYMLFALLDSNNKIVTSTYLGTDADQNRSFMIGSINDGTDKDVFYVYRVRTVDGKETFIDSQKYQKTLEGTSIYGEINRKQTLAEAQTAATDAIRDFLNTSDLTTAKMTTAEITTLQQTIAAAVTDQIEVTVKLAQVRTIAEKTTNVAGKDITIYQSSYLLYVTYSLKDLYEQVTADIFATQIALGEVPHLEDILQVINTSTDSQGQTTGEVKTVTDAKTSPINDQMGTVVIEGSQKAMTVAEAKTEADKKLPGTFDPESDAALSNLVTALQGVLTTNIEIDASYVLSKNTDYSYTCTVTVVLSDGTAATTITQAYTVDGTLMTEDGAKTALETSYLTGLSGSEISENTIAVVIAKAKELLAENIQATGKLTRTEVLLQTEQAYRYDYTLEVLYNDLTGKSKKPGTDTLSIFTFEGLKFMLPGISPVASETDPAKAATANLKNSSTTTNGTIVFIQDGYGYTIRPDGTPGAGDLYIKVSTEDSKTTYQLRIGSKTTNLERLEKDGDYMNYRLPNGSVVASSKYYIFSVKDQGTGSTLKLYELIGKGEAGSKLVGGDQIFDNGTKFLTNRIIALYPGSLTTSGEEQIVYVSLSAASEAVMNEARTLENSVIYLSLLTNQKTYTDDFGQTTQVYKDVAKRQIYQAAITTEAQAVAEKQIDTTKYFLRGYIEYTGGTEVIHYIRYTFEDDKLSKNEDLILDLQTIPEHLSYYNELFLASNKLKVVFDTESEIVFDTSKGGGIVLNPNGTIYYQPGILIDSDGKTSYDTTLRTTQLDQDADGNYYLNKNQQIKVTQDAVTGTTKIQMMYLDENGSVYAVYDLTSDRMKWFGETGYATFATKEFTQNPVALSAGTKLNFYKVTDSVLTIMNGSEYFYYESETETAGDGTISNRLTKILYAVDKINLIQLADGTFTEVKEIIEETDTSYTLRVADSASKTKEKIMTYLKSDLIEQRIMSARSVRDDEYNPVMMAIKSILGSYYIFPNGYTFGILTNGDDVTFLSEIVIEKLRHTEHVTGSTYAIGNIQAETVLLTFEDPDAVIRDAGIGDAAITGYNIVITTDADLGTMTNPIRINTTGRKVFRMMLRSLAAAPSQGGLILQALSGDTVYEQDAYIKGVVNPIRINQIELTDTGHLWLDAADVDAYLNIAMDNKSKLENITILNVQDLNLSGTTAGQNMYVVANQMSGALNLTNSGPSEFLLRTGDLLLGEIGTGGAGVILEAASGNIETADTGLTNIRAGSAVLRAQNQIGSVAPVRMDLLPGAGTDGSISAFAGGTVAVAEDSGNMNIRQIISGGRVTLLAPMGSIVGSTDQVVIQAPELVALAAGIGTASRPLWTQITGPLDLTTTQHLYLNQTGNDITGQIRTGGQAVLNTDQNIGSSYQPLNVNSTGAFSANAGNIYLQAPGNLLIGSITAAESLHIQAGDSILGASMYSLAKARDGFLTAAGGTIGTTGLAVRTAFENLEALGNSLYLNQTRSLVRSILNVHNYGTGMISLMVAGNLSAQDPMSGISAGTVNLNVLGNTGTLNTLYPVMADRFGYHGIGKAFLQIMNTDPDYVDLESEEELYIKAEGSLRSGSLRSEKLTLEVLKALGKEGAPLLLYTNLLKITGDLDKLFYRILKYVKPVKKQDQEDGEEQVLLLITLLEKLKGEDNLDQTPQIILPDSVAAAIIRGRRSPQRIEVTDTTPEVTTPVLPVTPSRQPQEEKRTNDESGIVPDSKLIDDMKTPLAMWNDFTKQEQLLLVLCLIIAILYANILRKRHKTHLK